MVSVPVYQPTEDAADGEEEQLQASPAIIRGFAVGIYNAADIIELAWQALSPAGRYPAFSTNRMPWGRSLYVQITPVGGTQWRRSTEVGARLNYQRTLSIGGREWLIVCTPVPGSYFPDAWSGWIVVVGDLRSPHCSQFTYPPGGTRQEDQAAGGPAYRRAARCERCAEQRDQERRAAEGS